MIYISDGISRNPSLTKLNVSDNTFTFNSIYHLVQVLCKKYNPKTIEENDVPQKEVNTSSCQLRELDLSNCFLDKDCINILADLLKSEYKLRTLNLKDNMIQDEEG
jgi:Ran GTPase-activating protein (RanGAP) involved in mRNA processing and transport